MKYEWRNEEQTILAAIEDDGHVIIIEPGHPEWADMSARSDITTFVPPAPPDPADAVRSERDARLRATDWTQLPDVPEETQEAWRPFRQALRDVPEQEGFPHDVKWPEAPS